MTDHLFDYMSKFGYEKVLLFQNEDVGLRAVLAIHSTVLGPAAGGCRMWLYPSDLDAVEDAMRLARGMTYKYAAAGVNLGGGKVVILGDPKTQKSEMLFRALGRFINNLRGEYLTGEDVGTTLQDMDYIRMETPYVITLSQESGGAGPIGGATAFGVLQAMRACAEETWGSASLQGRKIVVQGLGAVGYPMVEYLVKENAVVTVADIDSTKVAQVQKDFGISSIDARDVFSANADIYCPCALGGVINDETLPQFRVKIICGSANNQLGAERHGDQLQQRGILYAPDYIANAGGTVFDTDRLWGGVNVQRGMNKVAKIYERMKQVIDISKSQSIPTYLAADRLAEERIAQARAIKRIGGYNQGIGVTM
ncbi:MAG TPA: Glu/Leu/Phe/Val dehydrogenase dimerization domain-containing protein [Anaerolineae bacterium]|nr:Glu/Leu/Phe/Val dehydrogenase dimerization domain-containing protein [Anaerolineae bacterium]